MTEEIKKELPKEVSVQEDDSTVRTKVRPKLVRREVVDGKPKLGRPKKADILAKKKGNRGKVGRPAGDNARIEEFKARLLGTSGEKIINTLISKALDPDDKDQVACLKMCVDRVLPLSAFDASKQSGGTPQISINITGLNQPRLEQADIIDTDITDIEVSE